MHWTKLGRIFDPDAIALPYGCVSHAQSPQALIFESHVRIYFSTRSIDPLNGKFLSHVAFADFDRALTRILRLSIEPVLPLGRLGTFDEHGIFPFNVLRHNNTILGYIGGWSRRLSVSVETSIGLAVSKDGGTRFERLGDGPVLSSTPEEPFLVGDPFVCVIDGTFHMWYIFGTGWKKSDATDVPERTYKVGHAESRDGVEWTGRSGRAIIPDRLGPDECQAMPTYARIGDRHHLFFCYRETFDFRNTTGRGYRIGHAWSRDLGTWHRDDSNPALEGTPGDWDSDMQCYPHAFELDGAVHLLYNGNQFGRGGFGVARLDP